MNFASKYRNVIYLITIVLAVISGIARALGIVDPEALEQANAIVRQVVDLIETATIGFGLVSGYLAKKNLSPDTVPMVE